jgi:hypothetical protein
MTGISRNLLFFVPGFLDHHSDYLKPDWGQSLNQNPVLCLQATHVFSGTSTFYPDFPGMDGSLPERSNKPFCLVTTNFSVWTHFPMP